MNTSVIDLVSFLSKTKLFSSVSEKTLYEIAPQLNILRIESGQILIREGEPGDSLYLVKKGQLKVVSHNEEGEEVFLNFLNVGEGVGEISLLTGEKRTASVYAIKDSELVCFSKGQFESFRQQNSVEMDQITQSILERIQQAHLRTSLHVSRLLGRMEETVLRDIEKELVLLLYHSGEVVVREEEESDSLYIVISGRLRVISAGQQGTKDVLFELGHGQTVGEMGLVTGAKRTATVYAMRDSLLARLSKEGFERLLQRHPQAIMKQFAGKVIERLEAGVKGKISLEDNVATFTLIPINEETPLRKVSQSLVNALSGIGSVLYLDSKVLEDALTKKDVAQTPMDDPANISIVRWLSEQELKYKYVVYAADATYTPWTQRCLRQADRTILVASVKSSPELGSLELAMADQYERQVQPQEILVLVHPPDTIRPKDTRRWLEPRSVRNHYHIRENSASDFARLARYLTRRAVGVVMSGGGARGVAHLGAIKLFKEIGIPVDVVGGSSAGGIMSCFYAAGWDYETSLEVIRDAVSKQLKDPTLPILSFLEGGKMTENAKAIFGSDTGLEDLWYPCFLTTANLTSSKLMIHESGLVWKYIRGTSSLPGVFPPVMENGEMLVDGGLLNNLPTDVMRQRKDVGPIIALDVSGSNDFVFSDVSYESHLSGWEVLWRRINPFKPPHKVPTIGQVMMGVALISNAQAYAVTQNMADFYMKLSSGGVGLLEFEAYQKSAEGGYRSAKEIVASWEDDETFKVFQETFKDSSLLHSGPNASNI